jgi:phenylalanyl-tRNA synthetase beta chain
MSLRRQVAAREYQEVINFAFVEEAWEKDFAGNTNPVRLANPIASQMSVMRSTLIGGLVANVVTNRKRQTNRVRVFEIGRCFAHDAAGQPVDGYHQPVRIAALAAGFAKPEQWGEANRNVDFFDVKADLEALLFPRVAEFERASHPALHPGRSASVKVDGKVVGFIGELHPVWVQRYELGTAPVVFELDLDVLLQSVTPAYAELSRFPAVTRDLALVVDQQVASGALLAGLQAVAPAIVQRIELFDQYQGKGIEPNRKSLAFRVVMQETQRTLEDAEVDAAMNALTRHAEEALGAKLRVDAHEHDPYQGRACRSALRAGRAQQARSQRHGGVFLRGDPSGAGARRLRQALGFRQLPVAREAPAPRSQPQDGRRDPDYSPARGDLPRQPEAEGQCGATE